jgi:SAM-dependent methyltransferase
MSVTAAAVGRLCPACGGSNRGTLIHHLQLRAPDGHPLQGGYDIVACDECGTGYADVVIDPEYYDRYYAELAKYADDPQLVSAGAPADTEASPWADGRLDATADRIIEVTGRAGRLLDIGCGDGTLLGALKRKGVGEVQGIDPSPRAAAAAATRGIQVDVGSFSHMPEGLGHFDVVSMTGVLEHVWDVDEAMSWALEHLSPEGTLYLELPDASRYLDPYLGPFEDFNSEHVNHFSPRSLVTLGARFGLTSRWSGPTDTELAPDVVTACMGMALVRTKVKDQPTRRDDQLVRTLEEFAARSREDLAAIDHRLRQRLGDSPEFVLWGMGEFSMKLLAGTVLSQRTAAALVDGNAARQGARYGGVTIVSPESIPKGELPIIVGSMIRTEPIMQAIAEMGLPNPVVRLD